MISVTLEESQASLKAKLDKQKLSNKEVADGIRECFMNCQVVFMRKRRPDIADEHVCNICHDLIQDVYTEHGLTVENATPVMLRHIINLLNDRFDFMQDPELRKIHLGVMDMLLGKLEHNVGTGSA